MRLFLSVIFLMFLVACKPTEISEQPMVALENSVDIAVTQTPVPTPIPLQKPVNYSEYNITLDVYPAEGKIVGIEKLKYYNNTKITLDTLCFYLPLNAFSEEYLSSMSVKPYFSSEQNRIYKNGEDYGYIKITNAISQQEDLSFRTYSNFMEITLAQPLAPGSFVDISFQLESYVPKIAARTGGMTQDGKNALWLGSFIPTVAVYGENGFLQYPYYPVGNPTFSNIANYTVEIATPSNYAVIGTGNKKEIQTDSKSKKITTFSAPLVRDFAFAVSNLYKKRSVNANGIEINLYYFSELSSIEGLLSTVAYCLQYFGNRVAGYPYAQLNIVECNLYDTVGVDYTQVIFMDTERLNNDPGYVTLCREIADQWFYNIIGSNRIAESWISEGLAGFLRDSIFRSSEELDEAMGSEYNRLASMEMKVYSITDSLAVYKSLDEYKNTQYIKSKLMFYSLYKRIGYAQFEKFLQTLYQKFSFRIATRKDIIQILKDIVGEDYTDFFIQWDGIELPALF